MKRILLALLLIPSLAFAGPEAIENDLISDPKTGTYILGRMNEDGSTITATEGDAIAPSLNSKGQLMCSINSGVASATNPIKLEDSVAASGDAGVFALAVRNDNMVTGLSGTNGDYTGISVDSNGGLFLSYGTTNAPLKLEDGAPLNNDAGSVALSHAESAITQTVSATNRYGPTKIDLGGRLITAAAPAGETWQACGTATATTSNVQIKAGVASNRIYVTSWNCANSSTTVSTNITLRDGSSRMAIGGVGALVSASGTSGSFNATFPIPLRGTSATDLNFTTESATTSVICCAAGYISTI